MSATIQSVVWIRHHTDRHPIGQIAQEHDLQVHEVERMIAQETVRRRRSGTLPPHLDGPPVVTTTNPVRDENRVCHDHGPYLSQLLRTDPPCPIAPDFWTNCPQCDRIWQSEVDQRDRDVRTGMSERQRVALARIASANIPQRFADASIWNYQHGMEGQHRAWVWAREYCESFAMVVQSGRCAALIGASGTGKTHLAVGVLKYVIDKGATGYYSTVSGMMTHLKSTFSRDADATEAEATRAYTKPDLLVLDEVGRALDTSWEQSKFFEILNERYANLKPTVLVSNLPEAKFREHLTEVVVDRLRESGGRLLVFDWASQRSSKPKLYLSRDA